MESIRIAEWNANGLLQHLQTLEVFLKEYKIDICLVSETHCTKESYIKIQGYYIYHTIHHSNKARGAQL